ncbi:MAG: ATP-binding protein [Nostoc sp.]|uniref:ATP-binding protein n=1 Tax=Nostoc sp. TaxID=1180 RepID=UPI002FF88D74
MAPEEGIAVNSVFIEGGEIGSLMRSLDWSQTALGYVADWPQSLRSAISILLASKAQICLFWGSELITIYNDAYRPALASKHPWALGRPAHEAWSEVWNVVEPLLKGVVATGVAFWAQDHLFFLNRHGYIEETYFDVSYDPVRDESGKVGGVFCIVSETTGRVLGDRRLQTLSLLSRQAQAKTVEAACLFAIQALAINSYDIPFAMLYQVEADGTSAKLVTTTPIEETKAIPSRVNLTQHSDAWKLTQVYHTGEAAIVDDLTTRFEALPTGAWDKPPSAAWVVPLIPAGQKQIVGLLVLGINPHLAFEEEYRKFFDLLVGNMTIAIANAYAYEEERKRLEALTELDRAKTTFFNNVSHEFRTPLTLMLSPLKETLTELDGILPAKAQAKLEMVQRNGTRLLKLVNTLLDFSRIEAGRTIASYEPIDLATYTAELASIFRSAADSAGLQLIVDCPPLAEPVYVDREMWEKIVLNLLSNALKFTFVGEIAVSLHPIGMMVVLVVRDTGTGIPADEVPRLFERFYRVKGIKGRTFEGTGIGLSLVQELVQMHGGTITVDSTFGQGSTFTVQLPTGKAHLPVDCLNASQSSVSTASRAMSYVEEALGWLPKETQEPEEFSPGFLHPLASSARILLVDDNTDMRNYLRRILSEYYKVDVAIDGETALAAAYNDPPDLILSDVMMPGMDGIELLGQLRADLRTREIPILLLSARAGEESAVEGLESGADDYLVKPFSRRELLARVAVYAFRIGQPQQRQVAVLFKDISDRKLAEAALRESEELKQRILDSTHDCIKVLTLDGQVLYLNKGGLHLLDIDDPASFLNTEWINLWQGEDQENAKVAIAAAKIGNVGQFQGYCPTTKGKPKWWDVIITSVRNASGIIAQLLVVSRDITKQKQAEAEREQLLLREQAAREQAQTANRIKDEFLAVLSHELRSPLNPILGWSKLLRNGTLNAAKTATALETIERNAKLQAQLIEDLLDISRILSGKLNLEMAPVNLASTIEAAIETVRLAAEAKSIQIQRVFDPNIGQILGDSARLQQVFWNLLTNAVKFSFAGGRVEIRLECRDSQAQITVSDTGKGINPDFLPYVFESFRQADATTTRKFGGLGLGLAIVRHLVEVHGGTVQVDSRGEGQGAIFNVRFPLMKAQRSSQKAEENRSFFTFNTSPLTGIRVLIVDDDEDIRDFLGFVLEQAGAEVSIVTSAIEALQAVEQSPPDILLSDIGMPDMDGYMLIRQIRAMPAEQGGQILALALSAYAGEVNRQQALAAGFQQHVAKPIDPDALIAVILDIIAKVN